MSAGIIGQHLSVRSTSLAAELQRASPLARICAIKGLVSCLPAQVLCCPLRLQSPEAPDSCSRWVPIVDGALSQACQAMQHSPDAQDKHQVLQLLTTCLQRMRKILQVAIF